MSITSVVNDLVTSVSVINALKPLPPTISGYSVGGLDDTALDPAGGQTVQINGTGFLAGATITFDGSAVAVVTYVNPNRLTFTSPAKTAGTYTIYAVNPDGGTAIFIPGIIYSVLPTWTTSAGSLGSYYETTSISNTVIATGDAPITYSLFSGSLPAGSTLYANGVITGTAPVDSSSTTYSFTIQATDAQLQDSTRSFSLTINVDAVTWVSPANNTTYTSAVDSAIANVSLSATDAAGYNVSYSANALPTGLSLSGANISGTPTVIADSSTLLTATAATTNRSAVRTINWSITVANDVYFEYNTLLIPGASTTFVDDASTNNFAVTIFGDTKPNSLNPYTPGYYSNYFDGTGDYISVPDNVAFTMGAGDFTLECWVNLSSVAQQIFIGTCNAAGSQGSMSFVLGLNGSSYPQVGVGYAGAMYVSTFGTVLTTNRWYHIAGVRNGAMVNVYVDGVKGPDLNMASLAITDSTETVAIGRNGAGNFEYVTGYISNVRIVKGTAVYTANFTPPTTPLTAISGTSLLTCQSNRFIDNSANAFTVTVGGNTTVNSFDPFVPNSSYSTYGSGYFDGTGDYLTVPGNSVFAFGTGDFTVEVWLYANSISTGTFDRICATSDYNGSGFDWTLNTSSSGFYLAGTSYNIGSITTKRWHHLVYTRSGSVIRGFLNGNLSSYTTGASQNVSSVTQLNIGTGYSGTPLNGYLVDLRIIKGSIPAGYQTISTTTGTQIFTPPSEPLTAVSGTSLLTLQNNQSVNNSVFLDNSTNNFLVTRFGNTTQGTFSPYGGNWSNYFDGSSYLIPASGINAAMGTGFAGNIISFEMWIYPTNFDAGGYGQGITGAYAAVAANGRWMIYLDKTAASTSKLNFAYTNSSSSQIDLSSTASAIIRNQWNHIAITIDATTSSSATIKMFANGSLLNTFTSQNMSSQTSYYRAPYIGGVNSAFVSNFYGNISNYRILKGSFAYTGNYTPPTVPLTAITNTQLLTCQSNRVIDNSINNFAITLTGTPIVQRFSPFNPSSVTPTSYSGYFDGTGDYLTVPDNIALQFGPATNFTMELWFYPTATISSQILLAKGTGGDGFEFRSRSSGGGNYFSFWAADGSSAIVQANVTLTLNTWQHLAVVRSSGTMTLYKNGVNVGSASDSTNFVASGSALRVAVDVASGTAYSTGYFSNIRIVKGVAVYTGAFTPPTSPLAATQSSGTNIAAITGTATSLLTCQSTTFIDNSTNNFTISAFGNSQPTIQNPFGYTSATTNGYTVSTIGGSGYFDGTGDLLTVPASAAFAPGTGAFTVEGWYYSTAASGNQQMWAQTVGGSDYFVVMFTPATSQFRFIGNGVDAFSTAIAKPNAWNHFAVVRVGTSVTVYCNGVGGTPVTFSNNFTNTTYVPTISGYTHSATNMLTGYLSDLRYVNGTALYTSNFVPPSAPLTAVQNTSLLTNMTSAGIYDAAMMTNMETVADAKLSTAISKFGGSSMYFDGTGDYITVSGNQQVTYSMGLGDFTVEMWINAISVASGGNLYDTNNAGDASGAGRFGIQLLSNNQVQVYIGTGTAIVTGGTINTGTWYHIAYSKASGSGKLFVNGIQVGSTYTDTNNYICGNLNRPVFGINGYDNASGPFNGYIDDLRVTKGYARYTANFTPPTSAFPIY